MAPTKNELCRKLSLELLVGVGRHAQRPDLEHLGVEERRGVGGDEPGQRLDQVLRLAAGGADEDPVAAVDVTEDLGFGGELLRVSLAEPFELRGG